MTKAGGLVVKELTFNQNLPGKYIDLCNFETEVKNILTSQLQHPGKLKSSNYYDLLSHE